MDIFNKAKEAMGPVEKVFAGVPGIKGYKEKELRRESDKRVREMLAKKLADQKRRLESIQLDMVNSGQLGLLDDVDRVGKKMLLLIDRVGTASYGYAPLFDAVRVKEAQLDALAEFDQGLFSGVDRIKRVIDDMSTLAGRPENEWRDAIQALNTIVDNMNTDFGHRDEAILQAVEEDETVDIEALEIEAVEAEDDDPGLLDRILGSD